MNKFSLHKNAGFKVSSMAAGIRYPNRLDYVLFEFPPGTRMAGVFTQNKFCAAPVEIARKHLVDRDPGHNTYWMVNTGYANAGTGTAGYQDAMDLLVHMAALAKVPTQQVLPFSTGVIGERLPLNTLTDASAPLLSGLADPQMSEQAWQQAAEGIMTTDTRPKTLVREFALGPSSFRLWGMAKGSGMIHPNMATMLSFVVTDLPLTQRQLQAALKEACAQSFNAISVDGDTSTNDSLMLAALGSNTVCNDLDNVVVLECFQCALNEVCLDLALQIVKDAEGGTKCVKIAVAGAASVADARQVATVIATSPLVKTALFAADPNWGRVLAAAGRSGVQQLDVAKVSLSIGDVKVLQRGELVINYDESQACQVMQQSEYSISIHLNQGLSSAAIWTSDLSYDYVKINAEYRS